MNQLLLSPTDVLMLRDARPMEGTLAGHTLPWPTPDLISHALRAALHRSGLDGHLHEYHPRGQARAHGGHRIAKFGSVLQAGPFPVKKGAEGDTWYFPCPLDVELATAAPTTLPTQDAAGQHTSLPQPLCFSVASLCAPSKENRAPIWLSAAAWQRYIENSASPQRVEPTPLAQGEGITYADVEDVEHHYGIARDDASAAVEKGKFYSYNNLRIKPNWALGSWVSSAEKNGNAARKDILQELFCNERHIIVGSQQRVCSAELSPAEYLPLPAAPQLQPDADGKVRVKWILISPAIWCRHGEHPGGWLPNWIHADTGRVMLKTGDRSRRPGERREDWRARIQSQGEAIAARLVSAVVGKPITITGYATGGRCDGAEGPKSTQAAAPAGSVYYFECEDMAAAQALCRALHCTGSPTLTRRSELLGEQGFGLGLCAAWHFAS